MLTPIGKMLIGAGLLLAAAGLLLLLLGRFGISRLPGDISIQKGRFTFFFPFVSCLVLSVLLSIIMSVLARWRR